MKTTIENIIKMKGEVPRRAILDVRVLATIDDTWFKVSDSTGGIVLSFENHPHLTKVYFSTLDEIV